MISLAYSAGTSTIYINLLKYGGKITGTTRIINIVTVHMVSKKDFKLDVRLKSEDHYV